MAKTYRHVFTFEGIRPLDKIKSIETYDRLKDVPGCGENQIMTSGPTKTPRCNDITCGTFQVQISNINNVEWTIEDAVKFTNSIQFATGSDIAPEMIEELEDNKKKALEFLYENEYGEMTFGKLSPIKVTIKSRLGRD